MSSLYPPTKKEKQEIIQDFLNHLSASSVELAEEVEDENGEVSLEPFAGIKDVLYNFLNAKKPSEEESE